MFEDSSVALITPMQPLPHGGTAIDLAAFDRLLDWHQASGTRAVVVGGTTGESATLEETEYVELVSHAVNKLKGQVTVIAGTGTSSTSSTIARTKLATELGVDAVLVVTPAYNRPSQRGLLAHYHAVADASQAPVILYNVPGRTAVDLLPATAIELNKHPQIVAIKEAVADFDRIKALLDGGLVVLSGDDPTFAQSMALGAQGVISVASNIVPDTMARLCRAVREKKTSQAETLDGYLASLYAFLGIETNPVPAKWLLAQMGRCADSIRLPLVGLDSQYHEQGRAVINSLEKTGCQ